MWLEHISASLCPGHQRFARALLLFRAQPGTCDISSFLTLLEQNTDCCGHLLLQVCSTFPYGCEWCFRKPQDRNFVLKGEEELQLWANVALVLLPARFASVSQSPGHKDGKSDPTYFM